MLPANLQARVEQRNHELRRALYATLGAYTLWQIPALLNELVRLPPALSRALGLLAFLGALLWMAVLFRLHRLQRAIQADPALQEALNDERMRQVRQRAFNAGFAVVLGYLVLMRVGCSRFGVSAVFVLELGIFLAVTGTLTAFLIHDRGRA